MGDYLVRQIFVHFRPFREEEIEECKRNEDMDKSIEDGEMISEIHDLEVRIFSKLTLLDFRGKFIIPIGTLFSSLSLSSSTNAMEETSRYRRAVSPPNACPVITKASSWPPEVYPEELFSRLVEQNAFICTMFLLYLTMSFERHIATWHLEPGDL